MAKLLVKASLKPRDKTLTKLYRVLQEDDALSYVDEMVEHLAAAEPSAEAVHGVGQWLASTASHRGPVKIGIALLGITGIGDASDIVMTLGAHDEFTLFAATALTNGSATPEQDLWRLAQRVEGWGRIHCVERLNGTTDRDIKDWLLREGYKNSVMYEYLAYTVATTGDLTAALRRTDVDRELLTSAGEIIEALIMGGPAEDIGDIEDGPALVGAYLDAVADRASTLRDLRTATSIARMLGDGTEPDSRVEQDWTEEDRSRLREKARAIADLPLWSGVIAAGLESEDRQTFWLATEAAPRFGIETFDLHLDRVRTDPLDGAWYDAWKAADTEARREALITLARETFQRHLIVTGASSNSIGLGRDFRAHMALDWTLQELRHHPGAGGDLVLLGLASPTVRNRNMSLTALHEWPRTDWPDAALDLLRQIAENDPNEHTRHLARELVERGSREL